MSSPSLPSLVSRMADRRVLVVGDIMLDRFVRGSVSRISSEGPIPILVAKQENCMLGGAGNTLANLCGLGVKASIITLIGQDEAGERVKGLVASSGTGTDGLIIDPLKPTTIKTRFLSGHQQLFRVDYEVVSALTPSLEDKILENLTRMLPNQEAVILSDYGYHLLSDKIIRTAIDLANKHRIPILADPRGVDFEKYRGMTVITPNRKELSVACQNAPTDSDADVIAAATRLIETCGVEAVVATRSQDGMSIIARNKKTGNMDSPVHLRTHVREVFDVSGAGDTVIATIAAGLAAGASLVEAASLANIAGGIVVGKVGTAAIRAKELTEALSKHDVALETTPVDANATTEGTIARLCSWDEALEQMERWRARGLRVGFTNGCFDILHAGHVNYLNTARTMCDRLVLGLNTDVSVQLLKGPTRPINNEQNRATVIGALGCVDLVTTFGATKAGDDNTAMGLLRFLKPDIYFKGADYTLETLPEAPIVMAYGGQVKFVEMTEGQSTTNTIAKIGDGKAA